MNQLIIKMIEAADRRGEDERFSPLLSSFHAGNYKYVTSLACGGSRCSPMLGELH